MIQGPPGIDLEAPAKLLAAKLKKFTGVDKRRAKIMIDQDPTKVVGAEGA